MIPNSPTMTIPLRKDEHGAIRIGQTQVLLEFVIRAFYQGETPESIRDSYPTLSTSDVYAVIAYYLSNRSEIDAYIQDRDKEARVILADIKAHLSPEAHALRTRLRSLRDSFDDSLSP